MPIDYKQYSPDWPEIRQRILKRAYNRCEWPGCSAPNGWFAFWSPTGERHVVPPRRHPGPGTKVSLIVLTVAHKDHNVAHNEDSNLAAWCRTITSPGIGTCTETTPEGPGVDSASRRKPEVSLRCGDACPKWKSLRVERSQA